MTSQVTQLNRYKTIVMNHNFFMLAALAPGSILLSGVVIMARALVREDNDRFKTSLYYFLVSSLLFVFLAIIEHGPTGIFGITVSLTESILTGLALLTMVISILGISYHYIHRLMPEFFVRAGTVFSLALLTVFTVNALPISKTPKASSRTGSFMEADQYQARQAEAASSVAAVTGRFSAESSVE